MNSNDTAATELARLDRAFGVVQSAYELRGWHLVEAELHKPGVSNI